MYPMLKDNVCLGTYETRGGNVIGYFATNPGGKQFQLSRKLYRALMNADGTKPLDYPENGRKILPALIKHNLVQTSRFVKDPGLFNRFILFPFRRKRRLTGMWSILNSLLPIASLSTLCLGARFMREAHIGYHFSWSLYILLLYGSIALHETGHLISAFAYRWEVYDIGILLLGVIPTGAYVAHEEKERATKKQRIQSALSGIEMNILIAGICLMVASTCYPLSCTLVVLANFNIILAGVNLLPVAGLDGETVFKTAFDRSTFEKRKQKAIKRKDPTHA